MKRLLIVSHRSAASLEEIEQAVLDGATDDAVEGTMAAGLEMDAL